MYLKRIEVAGFKSFANRTTIEFENQVTAIVGPNGSGKSNITEAIRWVLGESSAKSLRGGKMPDIIFAGSQSRKPLNIAEVTLVLDNEDHYLPVDFVEVSVTRRLRRTGESDFFLNKQACRLKDIQELFMDSGLGKESFSIISQGKVEAIFSSKPEERRGIFEEAAGVLKYKSRKKQAESKLSETKENLSRLNDIVYELDEQLSPLREQKETATKYIALKEELTQVDVTYTISQLAKEQQEHEELTIKATQSQATLDDIQHELTTKEERLNQLRQTREELDTTIEDENQALLSVVERLKQAEGQLDVLKERSKHTLKSSQDYQESLEETLEVIEQLEEEKATAITQLSIQNGALQQVEKQLRQAEKEIKNYEKSTKELVEELRAEYVEFMQQQASVSNERKYLERQYEQEQTRNEQTIKKQAEVDLQLQEQTAELATIQASLSEEQAQQVEHAKQTQQLQELIETTKGRLAKAQTKMYELMREVQQVKARQKSLQEIKENYTGYYQGVREALKHRTELNIVGAVAELIEVPSEYTLAIETALGGAMQHVVMENEADARKAITFLKQRQAGRATFLPLTTIKARTLPSSVLEQAQTMTGFIGVGSQVLTTDAHVQVIIENLLGTVLIAEDLASANQLARAFQFRYRVVSLEGDVMNAGGSMTGGASKRNTQSSVFTQGAQLQELTDQATQLETQLNLTEHQVKELQELEMTSRQKLEHLRTQHQDEQLHTKDFTSKEQVLKSTIERLKKDQQIYAFELREWQRFVAEHEEKDQQLQSELQQVRERLDKIQEEMDTLTKEEDGIEKRRQALREDISQLQAKEAVLNEKVAHIKERFAQTTKSLTQAEEKQATLERQLAALASSDEHQEETVETLTKTIEATQQEKQRIETHLQDVREKRYACHETIRKEDDALAKMYRQQKEMLATHTHYTVQLDRLQTRMTQQEGYLEEQYHMTVAQARALFSLSTPTDQQKETITRLKREIASLGVVNTQAIEQFDQVNERYEFLTGQKDDLTQAKEQLEETMSEMDEEVKQRFSETFEAIKRQFSEVFPNMFGGGRAQLVLTQPDDLLHTGIEIEAQPPGKKLQSLSLLSGGERSLTAIALLFAIIQVRPVPFCILDEVEAALDEANVSRFGRYLKSNQNNAQFIVVTHRKGTMEAADALYGVTMEESGVSKVLSVKLEQVKEDGQIKVKGATT